MCMFQESAGATPTSSTRQRAPCWAETARQTRNQCFDKEEVPAGAFSECCATSSNTLYMSAMVQVSEECGAWCYVDPGSGCGDKRPSVTGAG